MVMGREWLKGMCWIDTQIIRKSLRSRLRCAEEAQEWIVVAAEACGLSWSISLVGLESEVALQSRELGGTRQAWRFKPHHQWKWRRRVLKISMHTYNSLTFRYTCPLASLNNRLSRQSSQCHPGSQSRIDYS
jgi:hypothetical protein